MQRLSKWGNSLGLRVPQAIAEQLGLRDGSEVTMRVSGDTIVISRAKPSFRLDDLLDALQPEHRHEEIDWGEPKGKDIW